MKKQYDYYLLVYHYKNGEEVHQPTAFQIGVDPKIYVKTVLEDHQLGVNSIELYPLKIGDRI